MARGKSGRLVIEIEPHLKSQLYQSLSKEDLTLKEWFVKQAEDYIKHADQLKIFKS